MARIQHLAISSQYPEKQAAFFKNVFGWTEIRRLDNPRLLVCTRRIVFRQSFFSSGHDSNPSSF